MAIPGSDNNGSVHPRSITESRPCDAWTTNRSLPVASLFKAFKRKTDQFRLNLTQSFAPGWQCDRVPSLYHLALGNCSGISKHATKTQIFPVCIPSSTSIPAPNKPTMTMTNYTHASTVTNSVRSSSASDVIQSVCGDSTITTASAFTHA